MIGRVNLPKMNQKLLGEIQQLKFQATVKGNGVLCYGCTVWGARALKMSRSRPILIPPSSRTADGLSHRLPMRQLAVIEYVSDEAGVMTAVETVHAIIDGEISAGTDPKNIFVCGISQGGALALASVLLFPRTLGGGAVLSGWVPFSSSVIGRVTSDAKKTPILWLHGMADELVLFSAGQAGSVFLKQAGMKCEFKGFANLGHIINDEEIFTLESWIKCRIRSSSSIWSFLTCFR
ncbi:carboxylesterase SOBER1-like isoform X1 [Wolffia australiana]